MRIGIGDLTCSYQPQIVAAANAKGIPPSLALAVVTQESSCNPNATSPANTNGTQDFGLFQLNSSNLASWGVTNPLDPTQNINAGVNYLSQLYSQYGGNVQQTLAAYNAGPGNVAQGTVPAATTQTYVPNILNYQAQWNAQLGTSDTVPGSDSDTAAEIAWLNGTGPMPASTTDTTDASGDGTDNTTLYLAAGALALFAAWAFLG